MMHCMNKTSKVLMSLTKLRF